MNAIIEARRRWGATGQAYTVHHGCATFCEVGHYLGARWARLGIGETWEEAFEAADVLLEDQRSEFRICSSLAMGDRDLAWQGG